ncbi:SH3 domain-containing protein [Streptomyces sp. NBC_01601]|uniref:SH3 domain-containing protein n=1 Tax=Streptomyces sp. NBC_01601 TaxID=2975892 RepID=UPI002E2BBC5D|nr:SH3 domain-containing protein [Streptomyces sp. NBC_01601]
MKAKFISRAGIAVATIAMGAAASLAAAPAALAAPASAPTQSLAALNTCPTWTVTGNGVNFRTGAGTNYRAIGQLYRGDSGTKLARSGSWIKIRLDHRSRTGLRTGTTGWVSRYYLSQCVSMQLD